MHMWKNSDLKVFSIKLLCLLGLEIDGFFCFKGKKNWKDIYSSKTNKHQNTFIV